MYEMARCAAGDLGSDTSKVVPRKKAVIPVQPGQLMRFLVGARKHKIEAGSGDADIIIARGH